MTEMASVLGSAAESTPLGLSASLPVSPPNRFALAGARVLASHMPKGIGPVDRDGFATVDMLVDDGRIAEIAPSGVGEFGEAPLIALPSQIVFPLFIDAHTHLDKAHIWLRAPNPTGDFAGARQAVERDREANWSARDVAARMEFCLRSAYAHGTAAIRTHIDSIGKQTAISWPVFAEARERWRGRIELQGVPLFMPEFALDPVHMDRIEAALDAHGSKILGAVTYMIPRLREALEVLFALAERRGWELDFHVDESGDPAARSLRIIAEMAIERRFAGRILVGHCCSLSRQEEDEQKRTIEIVARAALSVVSLPMCNMFLQDRSAGRTPRWRGVTALHELKAAGVNVMIASDNVRDPFFAYGDLDMLEVWREGMRIMHLDYPFADWASAVRSNPARAMGLELESFRPGARADMIIVRARDFTELFARPHADRVVLHAGKALPAPLPDYAEIDSLEGIAP
jgi:cytosine/creatinine deaminase